MAHNKTSDGARLKFFERAAIAFGRSLNETNTGKRLQGLFLRTIAYSWVRAVLSYRMFAEGLDPLTCLVPDRGVLLASNHRSFFDQYAIMIALLMGPVPWARQMYFPVRSNFFYEGPLGIFVNFAACAGIMYPPIFRQPDRAPLNREALDRVADFLRQPGTLVGMHPEGTRNKGRNPYEMLPAQSGIGRVALQAKPVVIPVFIGGLTNDFFREIRANCIPAVRRHAPVICVFGEPLDYCSVAIASSSSQQRKLFADLARDEILKLSLRERDLRRQCSEGTITDLHPGWLNNRQVGRLYARIPKRSPLSGEG